jgi:hypothetical protein
VLFPLAALALLLGVSGAAVSSQPGLRSLDPPAAPGAMAPNLTRAGNDLLLTWLEPVDPKAREKGHRLRFARLSKGSWSKPATVASGTDFFANWADFPGVIQGPGGALTVHWLATTGSEKYSYSVFLARSIDGGATWSRSGMLHEASPGEHGFVSWLPAEGGGVRAFWLDGREMTADGGTMSLRTAVVREKSGAGEVVDADVCSCCQTDAALSAGGPVVAYRDHTKEEIRDISVLRRTPRGWSQPVRVHADNWKIPGCPVNGPAIDASGRNVAVAWFTAAPPSPRVQVAFSKDGGATFGPPVLVDGGKPLGRVDLALDADGSVLVTWLSLADKEAQVRLRRLAPDGKAGQPLTLASTSASRNSGFPRMAISGGNLYVAWVEEGEVSRVRVGMVPAKSVR